MTDYSLPTLPFAWFRKPPADRLIEAINAICTPAGDARNGDIIALIVKTSMLGAKPLLPYSDFLVKTTSGFQEVTYGALDPAVRERIAHHMMEADLVSWPSELISLQAESVENEDSEQGNYVILLAPAVFIVFNEAMIDEHFCEIDPEDFGQNDLDLAVMTLGTPLENDSAHSRLLMQSKMDQIHKIFLSHFIPEELDIETPKLTPA